MCNWCTACRVIEFFKLILCSDLFTNELKWHHMELVHNFFRECCSFIFYISKFVLPFESLIHKILVVRLFFNILNVISSDYKYKYATDI